MIAFRKEQAICLECLHLKTWNTKACQQMPEARKRQGKALPRAVKGERPSGLSEFWREVSQNCKILNLCCLNSQCWCPRKRNTPRYSAWRRCFWNSNMVTVAPISDALSLRMLPPGTASHHRVETLRQLTAGPHKEENWLAVSEWPARNRGEVQEYSKGVVSF